MERFRLKQGKGTPILAALAVAILAACHDTSEKTEAALRTPPSPPSLSPRNPLFTPSKQRLDIARADIPKKLAGLLQGFGKVIEAPQSYDPKKPNLYLVGNQHFIGGTGGEEIYGYQDQNVRIFHALHALGVGRQFLEGVDTNIDLRHDRAYPQLGEYPMGALPGYQRTGKIRRAYVAIEGIYGDEVTSQGAENPYHTIAAKSAYERADMEDFPKALGEIVMALAPHVDITIDHNQLPNPQYRELLLQSLKEKIAQKTPAERQRLIDEIVLPNPNYQRWLKAVTDFYYYRIQGRNEVFTQVINTSITDGTDSVFIVGANHIPHLKTLTTGSNVFVILAADLPENGLHPFCELYTPADYRAHFLQFDLSLFGLAQKPTQSLFE